MRNPSTPHTLAIAALIGLGLTWPFQVGAVAYIRDEIRVNMRAGPGLEFKITELLTSGAEVAKLGEEEKWTRVRSPRGKEGWVPKGYVTGDPPASVTLPVVQAKLTKITAQAEEFEKKLAEQASILQEMDELREKNASLEIEVNELTWSSAWKSLATGALIIVFGMMVGLLIPRGSGTRNRLKL
ncbi:MAG: TIGR04211 family SH3 domain-containing protein [bacterium]|nr:TIGR04211 family SH3 domain-containing protein [bacterium]